MALNFTGLKHRGRIIKVHRKRTNIAGMSKGPQGPPGMSLLMGMYPPRNFRGRGRGRGR
jgi:hypothetical protein